MSEDDNDLEAKKQAAIDTIGRGKSDIVQKVQDEDDAFWDWTSKYPALDEDEAEGEQCIRCPKGTMQRGERMWGPVKQCDRCGYELDEPIEEGDSDDFWAETEKQDAKIAEYGLNEFGDMGFKRNSNWPGGTTLVANKDLRKLVRAKFRTEGWSKVDKHWYQHPSLPYQSAVDYERGRTLVTSMLPYGAKIEEDHHPEDPISRQVQSLLFRGKRVISQVHGARGKVVKVNGRLISVKIKGSPEYKEIMLDDRDNIEIIGGIDHYDIVQRLEDNEIDEAVVNESHLSDKIAIGNSVMIMTYDLMSNRRVPTEVKIVDFVKHPGARPAVRYKGKDGKVKSMASNVFKSRMQAAQNAISEAVVEVPAELRGSTEMTGKATSDDASEFMSDLGIDDEVSDDVVDPETGELLFQPGQTKRAEMKKGAHVILNRDDFVRGAKLAQPILHAGLGGDFEDKQEAAWELLDELRNSDFYNVVWRNAADLVDDPEEMMQRDYDVYVEVPVVLKRKDGLRLDSDDHDNIEEIITAVKNASTMGNIGIMYMGSTDVGTTARFTPTFH